MAYASNIHVAVYQVLDQVMTAHLPPPGAKATIHSIIDDLYFAHAPHAMIARAEKISVQMHHLEVAVRRGAQEDASHAREALRHIAAEWLDCRISH